MAFVLPLEDARLTARDGDRDKAVYQQKNREPGVSLAVKPEPQL